MDPGKKQRGQVYMGLQRRIKMKINKLAGGGGDTAISTFKMPYSISIMKRGASTKRAMYMAFLD
jgi:hypothetical protein